MAGGGGGFIPASTEALRRKLEKTRKAEMERVDSDVNRFLQEILIEFNDRDTDLTKDRLDNISEILGEDVGFENLLFGGSVAKHTYVDGLSDVDALVIIEQRQTRGVSPQELLDKFHETLDVGLSRKEVESVQKGALAVTVKYRDGSEVQLLPAVRFRDIISIPDANASGWNKTNPTIFQRNITRLNERLNHSLVPTIKLVKSLVSDLPKQQQITGYHAETLALDAARGYDGPMTPKSLLTHVLQHAAERVNRPIKDVTGQSRNVDDYLGGANSSQRRVVSQALSATGRRLEAATSIAQWKAMFGKVEK